MYNVQAKPAKHTAAELKAKEAAALTNMVSTAAAV